MGVDVAADNSTAFYADYYFAPYFHDAGYTVGVFGKHLNRRVLRRLLGGLDARDLATVHAVVTAAATTHYCRNLRPLLLCTRG